MEVQFLLHFVKWLNEIIFFFNEQYFILIKTPGDPEVLMNKWICSSFLPAPDLSLFPVFYLH